MRGVSRQAARGVSGQTERRKVAADRQRGARWQQTQAYTGRGVAADRQGPGRSVAADRQRARCGPQTGGRGEEKGSAGWQRTGRGAQGGSIQAGNLRGVACGR